MSDKIKGSLYVFISVVFSGTYGIWSKMMSGSFDEFFQGFTRSMIIVFILLIAGTGLKAFRKIDREDIKKYLIYSIPGSLSIPACYYGFTHLSIGTAILLFYATLTITSYALGSMFFNEKITLVKIISFILGIAGLATIYSFGTGQNMIAIIICSISGVFGGMNVVFTKTLSDKYSPIQLTAFLYGVVFIICLIGYIVIKPTNLFDINMNAVAWIGNIGNAVTGILSFLFVVIGYKILEPSVGGIIGLLEIPIGIMFGVVLFSEKITFSIIVGGMLIIIAALLPNIQELYAKISFVKDKE